MSKIFIFNSDKCVGCCSCSAACIIENKWIVNPRNIYSNNSEAFSDMPVINFSLACNHCEKPVCLEGCPSNAYYREKESEAILIDENKCIGCRYCQWNCPWDAPKYNPEKGIIMKCNLCGKALAEGRPPACVNACPTGALQFGESDRLSDSTPSWFPEKKLNPALGLTGKNYNRSLRIIPKNTFEKLKTQSIKQGRGFSEWSLVIFSFLAALSVASMMTSLIKGIVPDPVLNILIISFAGIMSLFHPGKPGRAWRAVLNIRTSPLSREIALFLIYAALSSFASISGIPLILIASGAAGFALLVAIDSVYIYSDNRRSVIFHSGQTFLSSLLMISFLTGKIVPFTFIVLIKLSFSLSRMFINKSGDKLNGIRFFRMAILIIIWGGMFYRISNIDFFVTLLFLAGELLDRILFYTDFEPDNIKNLEYKYIKHLKDEKQRG